MQCLCRPQVTQSEPHLPVLLTQAHLQQLRLDGPEEWLDVAARLSLASQAHAVAKKSKDFEAVLLSYQEVCRLLEQGHREESLEFAEAIDGIASVLADMEKFPEAIEGHTRARELRSRLVGGSSPQVATSLHNLGLVYKLKGDLSEAEEQLTQAVEVRRAQDESSPEYVKSLVALGAPS